MVRVCSWFQNVLRSSSRTRKSVGKSVGPRHILGILGWCKSLFRDVVWKILGLVLHIAVDFSPHNIHNLHQKKSGCFDLNATSCKKERFARSSTPFTSF